MSDNITAAAPRALNTPRDLLRAISESRLNLRRCTEATKHPYTASPSILPAISRFSRLQLLETLNKTSYSALSERFEADAASGLVGRVEFPVYVQAYNSNTGRIIETEGGIVADSEGYPLFYDTARPRKHVAIRPSAGHEFLWQGPDGTTAQVHGATFHPTLCATKGFAFRMARERFAGDVECLADSHLLLLTKAFLAYFDSIAATLVGTQPHTSPQDPRNTIFNVNKFPAWASYPLHASLPIVNVLGGSRDYQEFWAHCCFDRPSVYTVLPGPNHTGTTWYSHYDLAANDIGTRMVCICDDDVYNPDRRPAFYGRPDLILSFIEEYVREFGLLSQANEAFQIATVWPSICQFRCHISVPVPLHTADWLAPRNNNRIDVDDTIFPALNSTSPLLSLVSTSAASWAFASQIYDFMALITAKDPDSSQLKSGAIDDAQRWLTAHMSGPGVGWSFLFRHHYDVSPSFLQLTGIENEAVNWAAVLTAARWDGDEFPHHLRLLQAFSTPNTVSCMLPWTRPWFLAINHTAGIETGVSRDKTKAASKVDKAILRTILKLKFSPHGIVDAAFDGESPSEVGTSTPQTPQTGFRGLMVNLTSRRDQGLTPSGDRGITHAGHILENQKREVAVREHVGDPVIDDGTHVASLAIVAASVRVTQAIEALEAGETQGAAVSSAHLVLCGGKRYTASDCATVYPCPAEAVVHRDSRSTSTGWSCALWILRRLLRDNHSMTSLLRQVTQHCGHQVDLSTLLSIDELAGVCAILTLPVVTLATDVDRRDMAPTEMELLSDSDRYALVCADGGWQVVQACDIQSPKGCRPSECRPSNIAYDPAAVKCWPSLGEVNHSRVLGVSRLEMPTSDAPTSHFSATNLSSKVKALDDAIRKWDWKVLPIETVRTLHRELFPDVMLPRFLLDKASQAPSVTTQPSSAQHDSREASAAILAFLDGEKALQDIPIEQQRFAVSAEACSQRWPARSKATSGKNNLTVHDLFRLLDHKVPQEALALWFILVHAGNHAEYVASVALWLGAVDLNTNAWQDLLGSQLLHSDEDHWLQDCQELHAKWRKQGLPSCTCDHCWVQMLYLQALWGRGGVEVDWKAEIARKASPPDPIVAFNGQTWSASFATEVVRETIKCVMETALPTLSVQPFDRFFDRAYEWLVGGAVAGFPTAFAGTELRHTLLKEYHLPLRPTKRSVMETISRETIREQLKQRPQTIAKLHQKLNETGGKARAIYGVSLWHYLFSNWLMAPFERALNHPSIDINLRSDQFIELQVRRSRGAMSQSCFSSYDYPDFNSMHSHEHMSLIYQCAKEVVLQAASFRRCGASDQATILEGYEWLFQSVFTQVCYLPPAHMFIQTVGGLYSGNRDTTLINTILNVAYAKVVDVSCRFLGVNPRVEWRLCHGDDIIAQHRSYASALAWNVVASKANLKGQESKLLTDRSYHEYLRVMGCKDGKLRGSLARCIASFVCGNWETERLSALPAKVEELESSMLIMVRRGMRKTFEVRLRQGVLRRIRGTVEGQHQTAVELRGLLSQYAGDLAFSVDSAGHGLDGGENFPLRRKNEVEQLFLSLPAEVTDPYIKYLKDALPSTLLLPANFDRTLKLILQKSTYGSELPLRFQSELEQGPQMRHLVRMRSQEAANRGQFVKMVSLDHAHTLLETSKVATRTMQRIKALHAVMMALGEVAGYSEVKLLAEMCQSSEASIQNALKSLNFSKKDWRQHRRPSAPDVCGMENEVELALHGQGALYEDQEVVVYCKDARGFPRPVRDLMLY